MGALIQKISQWCAYSHLVKLGRNIIYRRDVSDLVTKGRNLMLLGIFCPFFWVALFIGSDKATLIFHAAHSSIVFLAGAVIMAVGLNKSRN